MRPLVLLAAPGAGSAGDDGLVAIESDIRQRFEHVELGWIYTSSRLLERSRRAGRVVLSPTEGVAKLQGYTGPSTILSLHLVNGREYGHLSEAFATNQRNDIVLTRPLLESADGAEALARALVSANPIEADDVRILVTHGSPEPEGLQALAAFDVLVQRLDSRSMLAALLGDTGFHTAVRFCLDKGGSRACLVPLLLTGGPSTQSLATPEDPVLAPFRAAGIPTHSIPRGLLAIPEVREIWLTRLEQVLQVA